MPVGLQDVGVFRRKERSHRAGRGVRIVCRRNAVPERFATSSRVAGWSDGGAEALRRRRRLLR